MSTPAASEPSKETSPDFNTRRRVITAQWVRDPNGAVLPAVPPKGVRTPNDLPWAHSLSDLMHIQRIPDVDLLCSWSRSMIKEFGESYDESQFDVPEPRPRRRRPWPVLRLENSRIGKSVPLLGVLDEGSDHEDDCIKTYAIRPDLDARHSAYLNEESNDDEDASDAAVDDNRTIPNVPDMSAPGNPYSALWTRHIERQLELDQYVASRGLMHLVGRSAHQYLQARPNEICTAAFVYEDRAQRPEDDMYQVIHPVRYILGDLPSTLAEETEEVASGGDNGDEGKGSATEDDNDSPGGIAKPELPRELTAKFLESLYKLEEFIPEQYFPDALLVHKLNMPAEPTKYVRIFPKLDRDRDLNEPERLGELWLGTKFLGEGNHSLVRMAPLKLPSPLSAYGPERLVAVAAKTANNVVSARKFLRNEAAAFAAFPRHLQEEWCGYNLVSPIKYPVPVGAVVPKFYGYYVPVGTDGRWRDATWERYSEGDETRVEGRSPILLMEACGEPIEPEKFSLDQRSECLSMVMRLHRTGFVQGSMFVRNFLWQPGPLTVPHEERSLATPSFRIIDFGRARQASTETKDEWTKQAIREQEVGAEELLLRDFDY